MKLQVNDQIDIEIYARRKWNSTEIAIAENEEYEFTAIGTWRDLTVKTDADGYTNWYMQLFDGAKREEKYNWFSLIGSLDKEKLFLIGKKRNITFRDTGTLSCFANDVNGFYWNNSGHITLQIKRIN